MKMKLAYAAAITLLGNTIAFAQGFGGGTTGGKPVPEIDALSGIAALAVVGAAVALIRERSK